MTATADTQQTAADDLGRLTAQAARIIRRAADHLDIPDHDWPAAAATLVLALPSVGAGRRAVAVLEQLANRHQPTRWSDTSDVVVCRACNTAWPCPDALIIHGPTHGSQAPPGC